MYSVDSSSVSVPTEHQLCDKYFARCHSPIRGIANTFTDGELEALEVNDIAWAHTEQVQS